MKKALYAFACVCWLLMGVAWADAPDRPIRALLTYGGHAFQEKEFYAMLDALPGIRYDKAQMPNDAHLLRPGLEEKYDVLVMYDMSPDITPEQRQAFLALLEEGIGLVSLHHNLGAHRNWAQWKDVIGGKYNFVEETIGGRSYGPSSVAHDQKFTVRIADPEHPITKGLTDFEIIDEVYKNYYFDPAVRLLLVTDDPKNNRSVAWLHQYKNSRVFYLQLGHDNKTWSHPSYPKLLERGIRWAAGR